ncbi:MAG: hypothetical protein DI548_07960, partial [Flavobacterium johnsoniae]
YQLAAVLTTLLFTRHQPFRKQANFQLTWVAKQTFIKLNDTCKFNEAYSFAIFWNFRRGCSVLPV